jgi:hypothetical protein
MILIACVDDRLGMLFHNRRQSQDRILRERILTLTQNSRLWMNAYSARQFAPAPQITIAENFLQQAEKGEFCFVENIDPALALPRLEKLILYRWNRSYPGDFFLKLPLENWRKTASSDFPGSSHEKITEEIYLP